MYKNAYQHGLLTIFTSGGSRPMLLWHSHVQNGHIKQSLDREISSQIVDILSTNVSTTYITCPKDPKISLGISLPFLVMVIKNLHKYFTFEVTILDESDCRRRFRVSNFQSTTTITPFCTAMPINLSGGWNQIQFNLAEFTRRAYRTQFVEVVRVQINANVRIKRIYFAEKLYSEEELPTKYKLFFPLKSKQKTPSIESQAETKPAVTGQPAETLEKEPSLTGKASLVTIGVGAGDETKTTPIGSIKEVDAGSKQPSIRSREKAGEREPAIEGEMAMEEQAMEGEQGEIKEVVAEEEAATGATAPPKGEAAENEEEAVAEDEGVPAEAVPAEGDTAAETTQAEATEEPPVGEEQKQAAEPQQIGSAQMETITEEPADALPPVEEEAG